MKIPHDLLKTLQQRLKTGNRRGVHLNASISAKRPGQKIDLYRLNALQTGLAEEFLNTLLTEDKFSFKLNWNDLLPPRREQTEAQEIAAGKLAKSFTRITRLAKGFEEDTGINNFAFGYPLVVLSSEKDGKPIIAPLLIWSLQIKQYKGSNHWSIVRQEDFPVSVNELFANYLEATSGADLRAGDLGELRDGLVSRQDLDAYVRTTAAQLIPGYGDDAEPFSAPSNFPCTCVRAKKEYEKLLEKHEGSPQIINAGLFALFATQKQNLIRDYDLLLEQAEQAELTQGSFAGTGYEDLTSVPTDPSQQDILTGLRSKTNLLIQGPPGTGKSQTLAATLANALYSGKRTLVVCEKRTALDVLHESLDKLGYGHLCGHIMEAAKDRRGIVDSVRNRNDELSASSARNTAHAARLDGVLGEYRRAIVKVNRGHERLTVPLPNGEAWTPTVGRFLGKGKNNAFKTSLFLDADAFTFEATEQYRLARSLVEGEGRWRRFRAGDLKEQWREDLLTTFTTFEACEDALESDLRRLHTKSRELHQAANGARRSLHESEARKLSEALAAITTDTDRILALVSENAGNKDFYDDAKTESWWYRVLANINSGKRNLLTVKAEVAERYERLGGNARLCQLPIDLPADAGTRAVRTTVEKLYAALPDLRMTQLAATTRRVDAVDIHNYVGPETEKLRGITAQARQLLESFNWESRPVVVDIRNVPATLQTLLDRVNDRDPEHFEASYEWYGYKRTAPAVLFSLLPQLMELTEWARHFDTAYYGQLLTRGFGPGFPKNDAAIRSIDKLEANMVSEQKRVTLDRWLAQQRTAISAFKRENPGVTLPNLYMKRSSANNRKKSLRAIIDYDWDLFTSFFPIILTVPDVASLLFQDSRERFDIVVFDEASQLRLEDTLPALLKARQRIVAGDEHQMPPSNFFQMATTAEDRDDEEEDEPDDEPVKITSIDGAADCESLLEFGEIMNFEKQYLDFHYRSRHPYLIDFSNHAFYGSRLIPQPNTEDYLPISFVAVNGRYANQQNEDEAREVVKIIRQRIRQFENGDWPSVGVATFNLRQTNLILDHLDEERQKDTDFDEKMTALEQHADAFFVKNLENIQGDERDVIILSTTAGRTDKGFSAGSLGRLNQAKGYKLLNVIVTRAKYKVYVCTSIPEELYRNYKDALAAFGANKRGALYSYLAYAKAVSNGDETRRQQILYDVEQAAQGGGSKSSQTLGELESVFEEEVYDLLTRRIDEDHLNLQEWCGGFRIDMVYQKPGNQKIAIECDGAKFHSSRQAYLHDRARQRVLEDQGYVFHRIWSTNFWRNPEREIDKLLAFIAEHDQPVSLSKRGRALSDVFQAHRSPVREAIRTNPAVKLSGNLTPSVQPDTDTGSDTPSAPQTTVEKNMTINVYYPGNGRSQRIRIVDFPRSRPGLMEIDSASELAKLLLGKEIGDAVKLANGKMVEVKGLAGLVIN